MSDYPETGIIPFLRIRERRGQEALDFYEAAFGGVVFERNLADDGQRLMQAALKINGAVLMLSDEFPEFGHGSAGAPSGTVLHLQVDNADRWAERAVAAGAEVTMPVADQFWGDRYGQVRDPFGFEWSVGHSIARGDG